MTRSTTGAGPDEVVRKLRREIRELRTALEHSRRREEWLDDAERAKDLVQQILTFSRRSWEPSWSSVCGAFDPTCPPFFAPATATR